MLTVGGLHLPIFSLSLRLSPFIYRFEYILDVQSKKTINNTSELLTEGTDQRIAH